MKQIKNKYWFKAKTYGYGWYPVTWQGWTIIVVYLIILGLLSYMLNLAPEKNVVFYSIAVFIITGLLVYISYKKGEPARWRWG